MCVSVIQLLFSCRVRPWSSTCCQFVPIETTITMDVACQALTSCCHRTIHLSSSFIIFRFFPNANRKCIHPFRDRESENRQWLSRDPLGDDLFRRHPEVIHKLCTRLSVKLWQLMLCVQSIYIRTFIRWNMNLLHAFRPFKSAKRDWNWSGKFQWDRRKD